MALMKYYFLLLHEIKVKFIIKVLVAALHLLNRSSTVATKLSLNVECSLCKSSFRTNFPLELAVLSTVPTRNSDRPAAKCL